MKQVGALWSQQRGQVNDSDSSKAGGLEQASEVAATATEAI